ncbi:unnamed protein product [Cuscuta epithymum]|uniref:RING-type E3 ubiquitin transferase n=1 Tax=Cuscuta epithymum TaxID=186058 RepID=A0AAV0D455_9ASTE|nr:unnamed protein product [Cuscuta epithymum]
MIRSMLEHTQVKNTYQRKGIIAYPPSHGVNGNFHKNQPPPPAGNKLSPAVLFIIIIVSVLFFVSALLHLLVRFLVKKPSGGESGRDHPETSSNSDALQRQLQQLFHQHDTGLDQAFIDALPVFVYREIVSATAGGGGPKEPFDCAVCLCEFKGRDKLRLLPVCGHAFHVACIGTWLLSNSTCPLCRGTLFHPGSSVENPMFDYDEDVGLDSADVVSRKEIAEKGESQSLLPVRLGKFCKVENGNNGEEGEPGGSSLDARRCFSMGSYQYVVGDDNLRVAFNKNFKRGRDDQDPLPPPPHTAAVDGGEGDGKRLSIGTKTDSFSISKIWLWSKKGKFGSSDSRV